MVVVEEEEERKEEVRGERSIRRIEEVEKTPGARECGDGGEGGHAHAEKETENINVKAAFIHVVGDFLQSLGILNLFYSIQEESVQEFLSLPL